MQTTPTPIAHWKTDISDLRNRASAVIDAPSDQMRMSARTVARCLSGVIGLVARRWSVDTMQRACAGIARHEPAWQTAFGALPRELTCENTGSVHPATEMIAVVACGILPLTTPEAMRAALSFWATESDVAVWRAVVADGG